jgi:hypothetical protein
MQSRFLLFLAFLLQSRSLGVLLSSLLSCFTLTLLVLHLVIGHKDGKKERSVVIKVVVAEVVEVVFIIEIAVVDNLGWSIGIVAGGAEVFVDLFYRT